MRTAGADVLRHGFRAYDDFGPGDIPARLDSERAAHRDADDREARFADDVCCQRKFAVHADHEHFGVCRADAGPSGSGGGASTVNLSGKVAAGNPVRGTRVRFKPVDMDSSGTYEVGEGMMMIFDIADGIDTAAIRVDIAATPTTAAVQNNITLMNQCGLLVHFASGQVVQSRPDIHDRAQRVLPARALPRAVGSARASVQGRLRSEQRRSRRRQQPRCRRRRRTPTTVFSPRPCTQRCSATASATRAASRREARN